ncbi:MAG: cytochrome c [Hyphomicrobiaceae bacterium]|nr:cytochrome c [Hyphomicrobiaceae bacterium]
MMRKIVAVFMVFLMGTAVLLLGGKSAELLAGKKANPVKERQKLMRSVGKAMQISVKMLKGKVAYDGTEIASRMKIMNEVAGKFNDDFSRLFPEGSDDENSIMDFDQESSAKADIWNQVDDFKMKSGELKTASAVAMKQAGDKAAFAKALENVGKSCKGCHQKYKADKKE